MPETARILQFPRRAAGRSISPEEARAAAEDYLATLSGDRSADVIDAALSEPDILLTICSALRELRDSEPLRVADEAPRLYRWLSDSCMRIGVFDERDYFLGESAFLAGTVFRVLGRREEAELWLDRAEASFRHTVNPAPALANVSYIRLALHYDMGRYKRVIELIPSLIGSFQKLGMHVEVLKCRFLEAASLKSASRVVESRERLERLRQEPELTADGTLHGLVLSNLGELLSAEGRHEEAFAVYQEALVAHSQSGKPLVGAHLKSALAESLRNQGSLLKAVEFYRAAIADYASLGMRTVVANLRVVVTETLLALDRPREAEWEILQALPTIEEQKMVPEGFAAVALLRESVKRRKADPNALRELREHLQKQK